MRSATASRAVSISTGTRLPAPRRRRHTSSAVDVRQPDVEHDRVRLAPRHLGQRGLAVLHGHGLVPAQHERAAQGVAKGAVVVDDQDAHPTHCGWPARPLRGFLRRSYAAPTYDAGACRHATTATYHDHRRRGRAGDRLRRLRPGHPGGRRHGHRRQRGGRAGRKRRGARRRAAARLRPRRAARAQRARGQARREHDRAGQRAARLPRPARGRPPRRVRREAGEGARRLERQGEERVRRTPREARGPVRGQARRCARRGHREGEGGARQARGRRGRTRRATSPRSSPTSSGSTCPTCAPRS